MSENETPPPPLGDTRDYTPLLKDPQFISLVSLTHYDQWDAITFLPRMRRIMKEVMTAVEAELEEMSG